MGDGACTIALSFGCSPTIDQLGHGTAVASAAAGSTYGVAKQAIIHPVRVGTGTDSWGFTCSDIIAGLDWVKTHATFPAVLNMSIGSTQPDPGCFSVRDAMDAVVAANILVFKAAGNDNIDAFLDRTNRSAGSVIMGGTDPYDNKASFSNWGPTVEMMAPSEDMLLASSGSDTDTRYWAGTSFASPTAAGAAAAILQGNPTLSASALQDFILNNASAVTIGFGQGVANRVVFSNLVPPPPPPPTISVTITGPTTVRSSAQCTWSAIANGGSGYSYAWKKNGSPIGGNTQDLTYTNTGSSFTLSVTVSGSGAQPGTDTHSVTISGSAPICQQA